MKHLSDEDLLRYSRQIFLPNVDIEGQEKLLNSHVLIMGVGGLGSLSASYLVGAGVGQLTLVDDDEVDVSNLHRQLLFTQDDIGELKVDVAKRRLLAMNDNCQIHTINRRLDLSGLQSMLGSVDLLLDGTDNFATRLLVNQACFNEKKPLLSAAVTQFSGQLSLFDYQLKTPCYQCLYPNVDDVENNCAENGILGPSAGLMASMQALHALKFLLGFSVESLHRLTLIDMLSGRNRNIMIQADENCSVCSH
ncbi:MAG: HesA/MoeB/ThiF family protein [Arenicella sp.]